MFDFYPHDHIEEKDAVGSVPEETLIGRGDWRLWFVIASLYLIGAGIGTAARAIF